jgi:ATP-dependent RNA helicase DeaD
MVGLLAAVGAVQGRALVLAAPAMVGPLGRMLARLAADTPVRVVTAIGSVRASRHLAAGTIDVLVAAPATALALHSRSALKIDELTSVVLAWPEEWDADEALTLLLGEMGKDAQRLMLTGAPSQVVELAQRHIRRSLTIPFPASTGESPAPPRSVRLLTTAWHGRAAALTTLLETLDPTSLGVWTADESDHAALTPIMAELPGTQVAARTVLDTDTVVCHDLPRPADLAALGAGRDVILMVPPGTAGYARRLAAEAQPILEAGAIDRLRDRDAALRAEIVALIDAAELDAASYAVAPLFERYDPQTIAAACFALWRRQPSPAAREQAPKASAAAPATPVGGVATSKLWVGVGRRDDATPGDLVAVLVREVGLSREMVGRIELRETFTLVEVPSSEADRAAQGLTGLTIRGRRLTARVDKGMPPRGGDRGGPPRGDRGGSARPTRGGPRPRS